MAVALSLRRWSPLLPDFGEPGALLSLNAATLLSRNAATQPVLTVASIIGITPLIVSSALCLCALLLGEEFDSDGLASDDQGLRQRLFAAFVASMDVQSRLLRPFGHRDVHRRHNDIAGVGLILAEKML